MEDELGELHPVLSVLNLNILLLPGLIGDPPPDPLALPAKGEEHPKSDPNNSVLNNLAYASFPPSLSGEALSFSPNVCSLDDDLHGINLSLQVPDFDGDDKLEIVLGDIVRGEAKKLEALRIGVEGEEGLKFCKRSDDSDIVDGRLIPLFLR